MAIPTKEQKTVWESEIDDLKKRNKDLYEQQHKLEDELRPHKDREYKEKQRREDERRAVEGDQQLVANLVRLEALVTANVKDPALRPAAFEHALTRTLMRFGPGYFGFGR